MLSVALLSLLVPTTATASLPAAAALTQQDNLPVTIWLNKRNAQLGDRVRAYARTNADGYLVVLHAEPDGRVRVLFPLDPGQDNFVRAGNDYEIHGRGGREAFRVYSANGIGTVYAAFSRDPFVFEPFSRADHWDYGLPETWIVIEDGEAELTDIAVTMASGAYFDYDYVQYGAGESVAPAPGAVSLSFYGGTYVGLGLGAYYYPDYYSWRRWALLSYPYYSGYPYYGWGWYDPFYYGYYPYWGWARYNGWRWPYYWRDPYWYGWGSHYRCCYYGGYDGWYYTYSNSHGYSTYSNGRIRYTPPRSPYNATSRTRRVYTAGHTTSPARRVALANGGTANGRSPSSAGRRTSSAVVRVADTPTRRAASTAIRNAGTSTRRSFPQQPVRTTPVRTSTSDTRSVAAAGRRESSVAPSSTRTTGSVTGQSRPVTTRRTTAPARPQVSPVRTTDVRRQVTSTRRTTTPSVNRSTTIRRPTSSVRPTTSRPSTSTPRQVTSAPRTRTTATVRRPSTPTRTPTRVSRPAAPRSTGSVSRSSGSTSSSTASKPSRRKKP